MELLEGNEYRETKCIYKITNTENGKVYIGSTVKLKQRINNHIKKLKENTHSNKDLQKDWNIHGSNKFKYEIVEVVELTNKLPVKEKQFIDEYKELNGVYNKSDPTEEVWMGRYRKKKKDRETHNGDSLRKTYILGWLDGALSKEINQLHEQLKVQPYICDYDLDELRESIKNEEIYNDSRIFDLIRKWLRTNEIYSFDLPNYKKEFRLLFGIEIFEETTYLVNKDCYLKIYELRKETIHDYKSQKRASSTVKHEDKVKKEKKEPDVIKLIQDDLEKEFDYLFEALSTKISEVKVMSFTKIRNFILSKTTSKHINDGNIDEALRKYIRYKMKLSLMNFESLSYSDKTIEKFNIDKRECKIIVKEYAKVIAEYNLSNK